MNPPKSGSIPVYFGSSKEKPCLQVWIRAFDTKPKNSVCGNHGLFIIRVINPKSQGAENKSAPAGDRFSSNYLIHNKIQQSYLNENV